MDNYKYQINQQALTEFFMVDNPSKEAIKAARMVATAVILKHYEKYIVLSEELKSVATLAMLERKNKYDPSYSAYNYAYTICRNEIGNYLNKQKEVIVDDILPLSNASVTSTVAQLPPEINKYKQYLTGEKEFVQIELNQRDAINLVLFCENYTPSRKITPPEFIINNKNLIPIMYRLLIKL